MGFKPAQDVVKLTFAEGHRYYGLEVRARVPAMSTLVGLMDLKDLAADSGEPTPDQVRRVVAGLDEVRQVLADHLLSWNVETDEDVPVPATIEGIRGLSEAFTMGVLNEWMTAAAGVMADLGKDSTSGGPSPEESLPMEPVSASRAS